MLQIIEEKDDAPIKSLAPARRRLKKIQGQGDKENDSPTEDLNITRAEPTTVSSRKPTRVLLDESSEEAASEPHCPAVVKNPTPTLSPIATAAVASPSRDADLHRQQLLDLVNDIENMRLSGGMGMTPDVESSSASEEADEAPNAATPQAAPVVTPMITTKKLTADEPSEGSAVEVEEEPLLEAIKPADSRGEEELHDGRYVENIDSERSSVQSPSVDEEADVQAHIAAKLLQNEAFFNSPITKHASPAVDSPLIVKRTTTMRRVVLSDDEDEMLPVTPAPKLIPSKLRVVESSDTEEKEAVVNQKGVEKQEQKRDDEEEKGDEGEDEEEDDEEDDEDDDEEEEEERKRPKNPFIDSEAEEASTPVRFYTHSLVPLLMWGFRCRTRSLWCAASHASPTCGSSMTMRTRRSCRRKMKTMTKKKSLQARRCIVTMMMTTMRTIRLQSHNQRVFSRI